MFSEHPESVSGVGFRVLTCISEIRAQGSCFQTWPSVGLEQLVGNGGRPAQQRGDKACQLSHLAKAGKRWSACTSSPSLPLRYNSRSALAKLIFFKLMSCTYFYHHLAAKCFFFIKSRPAEWWCCRTVIHFEQCGRNLCSTEAGLNFCCLLP